MSAFSRVHWIGDVPDWRGVHESGFDPDDDEMDDTPPDVVELLGFDPKEFSRTEKE